MSLHRAEQALSDYLERLLAPVLASEPRPPAEPPALLPTSFHHLQHLLDQVSEPTQTDPVLLADLNTASMPTDLTADTVPVPVSAVASAVASVAMAVYTHQQYRDDLPARFPTLVFRVDQLKLALPLHLLGGIQRRDRPLTPLIGRAEWFLGLLAQTSGNLNVVDTGRYLLGDKYRAELVDGYQYVIRIGDSAWGLACTDLCATRSLSQDEVRWYDSNPHRPWLAGIIKEDRCAMLNSQALVNAFEEHGRHAA